MTEQERYIEGQKASGIEVGDTVHVARTANNHERGWGLDWLCTMDKAVGREFVVTGCSVETDAGFYLSANPARFDPRYPYFVLEIVKKADGSGPNLIVTGKTEITGDSNMKTQEIYSYVVTINVKKKDDNGQIESIRKTVLDDGTVAAYDVENAKLKVMADLGPLDEKADIDEVEVLVRPFCG